jgi:hypothetical protein
MTGVAHEEGTTKMKHVQTLVFLYEQTIDGQACFEVPLFFFL